MLNLVKKIAQSISHANNGIISFFKIDYKAKIHLAAAILILIVGLFLDFSSISWLAITFCVGLVFAAEMFNTALEKLCNKIQPEIDPDIKTIKDIAAAAVWVTSLMAAIVGVIVIYMAW
jgi:diacylglycerol kinase